MVSENLISDFVGGNDGITTLLTQRRILLIKKEKRENALVKSYLLKKSSFISFRPSIVYAALLNRRSRLLFALAVAPDFL